nr:phosphatidylinositol-4,5-bisphosphate 3-kinase catalytic subunit alpha/beta/delta [Propylea japonica]
MSIKPTKFLEIVLTKKATIFNTKNERPSDYVLKVCGRDDFIMGEEPLINFQYIQDSLSYGLTPVLVTVNVCDVPITTEGDYECIGNFDKKPRPSYSTLTLRKKGKCKSAWDLITNFRMTLSKLRKLNLDPKRSSDVINNHFIVYIKLFSSVVGLQVGLFHGGKSLCEAKRTDDLKYYPSSSYENQIVIHMSRTMLEYAQALGQSGSNNITTEIGLENIKNYEKNFDYDNFYEMHDQDRKNIWNLNTTGRNTSSNIAKILIASLGSKETFAEVVALLKEWPLLPAEKALELLDYAYADQEVRSYAVQCLQEMSDDDLLLYLLQLVQALKHELFLEFPSVSVRFGLILEAYCRGHGAYWHLTATVDVLEKLKKCQEVIRTRKDKDKAKSLLQDYIRVSPQKLLCSRLILISHCPCGRFDKCRVMDSKMRPLWIVFGNADSYGDDIYLIFKNGDDLRQDMLTLQLLRIMDKLWKQEGLDLRMNVYNCVSTDNRVGLIEVVLQAETIANIQKGKGMFSVSSAFRKGSIFAALNQAVNEFTLSCAGYCVATYVLGIGDRHSDNIMIKRTGQLFHVDFGHILGHFKEKFGIKRERVPFVLTHDFVHVINKGAKYSIEFKIFQEYCEKAFLILRKHGNLILSLCAMMISTGLPELSSEKDLNYLRETLVLLKSEKDALEHFKSKFNEALSNSWKTSLNWASHNLAKNNT